MLLLSCHCNRFDLPLNAVADHLDMTDHLGPASCDQNLTRLDVAINLGGRVVGKLKQGTELRAWSVESLDGQEGTKSKPMPDPGSRNLFLLAKNGGIEPCAARPSARPISRLRVARGLEAEPQARARPKACRC